MTVILEAVDVTVQFGDRLALDAATFALAAGSLTAVLGPNGSGKSTLLRTLVGLERPESGRVLFRGTPIRQLPRRDVARRVAFLPQDTRCDFAFTVEEMVDMGRHPHRGRFEARTREDRDAVEQAIALCDLRGLRHRTVDRLSGGERQRVAIARCLATRPDVIVLDEPTAHLDLEHTLDILSLCRDLTTAGTTIAFATHDLDSVLRYATAAVLLSAGRVCGSGTPAGVLTADACRDVFAVRSELVTTSTGRQALVFDRT